MSKLSGRPPQTARIAVEKTGFLTIYPRWHQAGVQALMVLTFLSSALLVWVFGFTYWTILRVLAHAFGWRTGHSVLAPLLSLITRQQGMLGPANDWPLDSAIALSLLSTWCCLYLAFDHLILFGNRKARLALEQRLPDTGHPHFLVELRPIRPAADILPDLGILALTPTGLRFTGERQQFMLPRSLLASRVILRRSFADLAGAYLYLPFSDGEKVLQLLCRDTASRLSETVHDARLLEEALTSWLDSPDRERGDTPEQ